MHKNALAHLARSGTEISVRVTPKASRNAVLIKNGVICVYVTAVPENGKATREVQKLLAKTLGLGKGSLILVRGDRSREKVFRVS